MKNAPKEVFLGHILEMVCIILQGLRSRCPDVWRMPIISNILFKVVSAKSQCVLFSKVRTFTGLGNAQGLLGIAVIKLARHPVIDRVRGSQLLLILKHCS